MTIDKMSGICGISAAALEHYRELGLLPDAGEDETLRRLGGISSFAKAGLAPERLAENPVLLDESAATLNERVRIMKKERFRLLDELHAKQQALDCLDCIIRKIKSGGCVCR